MKLTKLANTKSFLLTMLIALSVFSTSCGDGSSSANLQIPGVKGPTVTMQQDNVLISIVMENLELQGGLRYSIPKYQHSYIEISPDLQSNGTLLSVYVSLKDVFDGNLDLLDPQALPGGRPLPGVASGKLPAVAFTIQKLRNVSFYLGPKLFGIFMPINLDIGTNNIISARFYSGKIRAGNLSMVGKDEMGENSGFLLLLDMGNSTKKRLKSVYKRYN
ncbi:hypothetical protein OAT67_07090 [Bacteriovoracaceae bacterium]|nr:hypothetical protein [Bacteriovoracaceae bacterium]